MRRLLELLRPAGGDPDSEEVTPSVGLEQVPALMAQAQQAGLPIEASYDVSGPPVSPGLDAAAYRIVQEAITNILKHAPGARAKVCIRRSEQQLEVSVDNSVGRTVDGQPNGVGYGLIGMRQRAELYGGHFSAASHEGGFRVSARFPVGDAS